MTEQPSAAAPSAGSAHDWRGLAEAAARVVSWQRPGPYEVAIVLGSGLGQVADAVEEAVRVPYGDMPGFPGSGVSGHAGTLVAGRLSGRRVIVFAGRAHFYEHGDPRAMRVPIATAAALGCTSLLLTNAAGSTREDVGPGSLMSISDHIAFSGINPLIGEPSDARFVNLVDAYDPALRRTIAAAAERLGQPLSEGVYMWFSGPAFETPAEIRMARTLGADAVGMSTVPEVILARFMGLKVAALSTITNYAAGMVSTGPSHQETKDVAGKAAERLTALVKAALEDWTA